MSYEELAWNRYDAITEHKYDRSEFEDEYCGTYDSIEAYMTLVYLPQLEDYPEHDNRDEYSSLREHAEGLRGADIMWWIEEQNGTVHVFELP